MRRLLIFISAVLLCLIFFTASGSSLTTAQASESKAAQNQASQREASQNEESSENADESGVSGNSDGSGVSGNTDENDGNFSSVSLDDFDFSDMEAVVGEYSDVFEGVSFKTLVKNIINNDFSEKGILNILLNTFVSAFQQNRALIMKIILLAVFSAGLNLVLPAFNQKQVSDISQIILYIALTTILAGFFYSAGKVCSDALEGCLRIYKAIIPAFLSAVTLVTGSITSGVYYEIILMMITVVNLVFKNGLLGLIRIDFMLTIADSFTSGGRFTKICSLIPTVVKWTCRAVLTVFSGVSCIKGMIVPLSDTVKKRVAFKALKIIPGVGDSVETVSSALLSAGAVIKNGIGIAGMVVMIAAVGVPIIELASMTVILKVVAAVIEPAADKKFVNVVDSASTVIGLMTLIVLMSACLFILLVAIICMVTNVNS